MKPKFWLLLVSAAHRRRHAARDRAFDLALNAMRERDQIARLERLSEKSGAATPVQISVGEITIRGVR